MIWLGFSVMACEIVVAKQPPSNNRLASPAETACQLVALDLPERLPPHQGDLHGAIEDAWLAMQIYLWLHGCPLQGRLRGSLPRTPSNFRHAEIGPPRSIRPQSSGMSVRRGE